MTDFDVIVVGAGPVGLFLAAELRLGGAKVLVLERDHDPVRPAKVGSMGARALNTPTVAALELRGLLSAVRRSALSWFGDTEPGDSPPPAPSQSDEPQQYAPTYVGHFAGIDIRLDRIEFDDPELAEAAAGGGVIAQQDLENILAEHAVGLGVQIRRGVPVMSYTVDDDGVTVVAGEPIRAAWQVGCDGGRSTVRKLGGFAFPGFDPLFTGRQALVELADSDLPVGVWRHSTAGSYVVGGWGNERASRIHTVEWTAPDDRYAEVTPEELQESLCRVSGMDVRVRAVHAATRYADTTRQADTYRRGRVLLAGDAAHVHSPAGGQGLNLGIGDAMNLGWKLAAVARGLAPENLLDTYTAERHPIGAWVQNWTLAQTALTNPAEPRNEALRTVMADLLDTPQGATYVLKKIIGTWQCYDLPGTHPLIGHRIPLLALSDGTVLSDHSRDGRAILLDAMGVPALREIAARWGDRITLVTAKAVEYGDAQFAVFVRPDGHVAWVAEQESDVDGLAAVLTTWLGRAPIPAG